MSVDSNDNPLQSESTSSTPPTPAASGDDLQAIKKLGAAREALKSEIAKVIVGQQEVIDDLLTAIFSRGHCLMIGVPGLAKTLMVRTIADAIDLDFNRIQFTPDLMPSDITGTDIIEEDKSTGAREFKFVRGPVFANILLADEINRTPPKTQASLLQAMQELEVTTGGKTYELPRPCFVLGTPNTIEEHGTNTIAEAPHERVK
ncbi:MAG: AAA family ATPase, partial [Planctomycetota bacterium]|nr:AAA family ATPase [Planctomycetota bacterium]